MPMVPEFHGNVPQVRDNEGSSFSPATLQQSNFDYKKVLTEAMKPVTDFADSATETLKVMHARTVKAESDDAEKNVVEIINTYMNDPDNGYLAKQGKNAMDGYQGAVEGMQKDIDKVIGGLQPTVREAIQSRLEDRMTMAITKANQWRATQTQQYHLQSSKSHEAMHFEDASMHYADTDYLNKTWGAIELEIDFQTQNLGLPPETIKQLKKQKYSLFQAQRFQAWAEKDPVGALMNFRGFKGDIDPDVKSKISKSLFSQSRDLLALGLVQGLEDGRSKQRAWLDDPKVRTGDAFIDSLPKDERLEVVMRAKAFFGQVSAAKQGNLKVETANSLKKALTTGGDPDMLTKDTFVNVYGEKEGEKLYDSYLADFNMNSDMFTFKGLSNTDIDSIVKAPKPEAGSENYAEEYKRYETRLKAANKIKKQRTADPVQFAIENEMNGYKPLDFSNTQSLTDQLQTRLVNMNEIADQWGTSRLLFSKGEAKALVATLDTMDIDSRVGLLSTIGGAIGMEGIGATANQLKGGNASYALAMASIRDVGEDGISVGEKYLRGKDAIAQKRVTIDPTAEYGLKASIYSALGDSDSAEAVFTDPQTLNNTAELVTGVYGYNYVGGGSVQESIEQAVGVLYEHNGKKIVLPKNVRGTTLFGDDFDDKVLKHANELRKSKEMFYVAGVALQSDELADLLPKMKLQTYGRTQDGGVTYELLFNGEPVQTENDVYLMEIR